MPADDLTTPAGRHLSRIAREKLFERQPKFVKDLMKKAHKEARQRDRQQWWTANKPPSRHE